MNNPVHSRRLASVAVAVLLGVAVLPAFAPSAGATVPVTPANGQGDLVVVGDSLMEGSTVFGSLRERLTKLGVWTTVTVDYRRGRKTSESYPVVRKRLAAAENPTALVIALGTNDMISHSERSWPARVIDQMMIEAGGLPVLWVNTAFNGAVHPDWKLRATRFNRALRAARSEWPNLRIADWSAYFVPKGASRYIADGVHLSVSGYRTRAIWMTSQIKSFATDNINEMTTTSSSTTTTTTVASTSTSSTPTTSTTTVTSTT